MAKTLTTPINIVNNINQIFIWKIMNITDNSDDLVPSAVVTIQLKGGGGKIYGALCNLRVFDSVPSQILSVNPNSMRWDDQVMLISGLIPGAYTTLIGVLWGTSGNKAAKLLACESSLITLGLVSSAFAGT